LHLAVNRRARNAESLGELLLRVIPGVVELEKVPTLRTIDGLILAALPVVLRARAH
jgi:hypothetical protein